jgi:predicted metalloprotease with PDZ domain
MSMASALVTGRVSGINSGDVSERCRPLHEALTALSSLISGRMSAGMRMPTEPIRYTVSMKRASAHYLDVKLEVEASGAKGGELHFAMPVWAPGHYRVEDYARNVDVVRAFDAASGRELQAKKLEKSRWSVALDGAERVRVEYSVYGFTYSVEATYVDDLHALINGASVFLYVEGMTTRPARLKVIPYPGWKSVSTGLEQVSDWEFEAPDYDRLVDSPLEVGNQDVVSFEAGGARYEVSMYGPTVFGKETFVEDVRRIVEATVPVFGHLPYKRYVFIVNFTDTASGGLEHLNSTMCFLPRFRMIPREEYHVAMGLFSHEFFHAWNVKRMRPVGLGPFNYSAETYTRSLWIAEGVTSYYDDLILRRSGIYSPEEYLDVFADNISLMKSLPGSRHQSAEEASFDTWTKFYKSNENSPNVTSSYYTQGAIVGWMLDMVIRREGHGTLDDVMKRVYSDTYLKEGRGYTDLEFEGACVAVGGGPAKEVFDSRVRGRDEIDFDRYLGYAGLKLGLKTESKEAKGFLGVKLDSDGDRTTVKGILAGSPAEAMGLSVNDEIVGIGELRVNQDRLSFYVSATSPGEELKLTVARNGRLAEVSGKIGPRPTFEWRIYPSPAATEPQKALFKGWLLADWKPELKYPEYTRSPDRKRLFDYV